jgi:hypothetical protein
MRRAIKAKMAGMLLRIFKKFPAARILLIIPDAFFDGYLNLAMLL